MTVSVRLNNEDTQLFKKYADMLGISLSELLRSAVIEKIEDEIDLKAYEAAMREFEADPTVYTLDEVEKELSAL